MVVSFTPAEAKEVNNTPVKETWSNLSVTKKALKNIAPTVSENLAKEKTTLALTDSVGLELASAEAQSKKQQINVEDETYIKKPFITETEETKEPPKPQPVKVVKLKVVRVKASPAVAKETPQIEPLATDSHRFPYGYCTYYVAQKRTVPWSGNAGTWLNGARNSGYETGNTPKPGAIMVTSEGKGTGHVAYVESVDEDQITVSEMNYKGFGKTSTRTISSNYGVIKGYIY